MPFYNFLAPISKVAFLPIIATNDSLTFKWKVSRRMNAFANATPMDGDMCQLIFVEYVAKVCCF